MVGVDGSMQLEESKPKSVCSQDWGPHGAEYALIYVSNTNNIISYYYCYNYFMRIMILERFAILYSIKATTIKRITGNISLMMFT